MYKAASLIVQTYFRRYICRRKFLEARKAATTIQNTYRMYRTRKQYKKTLTAINTIQKWYCQCRNAKTQRQEFLRKRGAIICIQSTFRGYVCRKQVERMNSCATKIQAYYRMSKARTLFMKQKSAVTTIQMWYCASVVCRRQRQDYATMRCATVTIQSFVRQVLAERKFRKLKHTVVRLQSLIRMHQVKKFVARKRDAVTAIQRRWRATRQAHITRENFLTQKKACVKLQAAFRMHRTRKRYTSMKTGFIKLQATFRMRQQRQRYLQQKHAVCIIQSNLRAYCMVQRLKRACRARKMAVTMIQTHWRAFQGRQRIRQIRAAICIQAMYRSVYFHFYRKFVGMRHNGKGRNKTMGPWLIGRIYIKQWQCSVVHHQSL